MRARAVRVVEMMLYSYESDILVMKLMEYGDLLHQLLVIQGRTDFNHRSRPLGLAVTKHLPPADRVDAGAGPRGSCVVGRRVGLMAWVTGSRRRPGSMRRWAVLRRLPVSSC